MKFLITNIVFLTIWLIVGRFFPQIWIFLSPFVVPPVYFLSIFLFKPKMSIYLLIPIGFALLIINDYIFKISGLNPLDGHGRGICELVFHLSTLIMTLILVVIAFTIKRVSISDNKFFNIFYPVSYILMFAVISVIIYYKVVFRIV